MKNEKTRSDPLPLEKRREPENDARARGVDPIVVRDAEKIDALRERTRRARRVLLVGNGGIAMELADRAVPR